MLRLGRSARVGDRVVEATVETGDAEFGEIGQHEGEVGMIERGQERETRGASPVFLVDARHEVPLARVLRSDGREEVGESFGLAGAVGQRADAGEEIDGGPVAGVVLGVDVRGRGAFVDRDRVERDPQAAEPS
jgi:hypothetical protein